MPGILQWPGHVEGRAVSDEPVSGVDVLPTLCEIAGIDPPTNRNSTAQASCRSYQASRSSGANRCIGSSIVPRVKRKWRCATATGRSSPAWTRPIPNRAAAFPLRKWTNIKQAKLVDFELFDLKTRYRRIEQTFRQSTPKVRDELQGQTAGDVRRSANRSAPWPAWEWPKYESKRIQWPDYWLNRKK